MQGQNQRRVLGDAQTIGRHCDPLRRKALDFLDQRARIEHNAVANDRQLAWSDNPGRQQRELVGDPVDHQRMAGIVPALEADHDVGLLGQPIDDLAFALVPPLGADHDHIGHEVLSLRAARNCL